MVFWVVEDLLLYLHLFTESLVLDNHSESFNNKKIINVFVCFFSASSFPVTNLMVGR